MEFIFEFGMNIVAAYIQIMMILIGGLFLFGGCIVFGDLFQKKGTTRHWFTATITGIREGESIPDHNNVKGKLYYPVFEGVGNDGKMHQYECTSNSSDINHYKTGQRYQVALDPKQNGFVNIQGYDKNDIIAGSVICAIGAALCGGAIKLIPFSQFTFAVWGVTAVILALKFYKSIKPKHLRETMAQFRTRRGIERLQQQQSKPTITKEYVENHNRKFDRIVTGAAKLYLVIGFAIMALGGAGYNAQQEFIDNAVFEKSGPCGLELGEDCKRKILLQDALSMMPIQLRPVMNGIYHSKYDADKIIVDYGWVTSLPYLIMIALGFLVMWSNVRKLSEPKQKRI